ncbi:DUF3387 domain-containing protein [Pseudorhodobacter turbinis]|uniref:DUF3387 domain-containing protein n=1 Tax=Pseudorhodobacter turbinis TaxID=2500533 RepID=A0A4P8EDN0_9RHOB|nr:DUF3387 domain-containing protein [Pseudorhodobacter turbinis]
MFTAKLGHRHTTFGLAQDRKDLGFAISGHFHSKSPRSSCRENSTSAAPYFRGGLPWRKDNVRTKMRVAVKRILKKHGFPPDLQAEAIKHVVQQAEAMAREMS